MSPVHLVLIEDPAKGEMNAMVARATEAALPLAAMPDWDRVGILEWHQPRLIERRWELHADGERVAVVRSRGVFHRGWMAETAAARWEIRTSWGGIATIQAEGDASPLATFRRRWLGGRIHLADGHELRWRRTGWWSARHVLANDEDFEFMRIRRRFSPPRVEASVELTDAGRRLEALVPMLLLGWVLVLASRHHGHAH